MNAEERTTADCSWEEYESAIYAEVAYLQKRDKIVKVIGRLLADYGSPDRWPGCVPIANSIMEAINGK